MQCPICEKGYLKKSIKTESMYGVELGKFPALVCEKCNESYTDEETTKKIEQKAKEKGIFGLGMKTKIAKAGNSLAVRIPKNIADYLGLKPGDEAFIHPEKNKLIVDI